MACNSISLLIAIQIPDHLEQAGEQQACRFGALRRRITGIPPKVLTTGLRELEADGLVWREQENTIPPKVTYELTETGFAVHAVLKDIEKIKV